MNLGQYIGSMIADALAKTVVPALKDLTGGGGGGGPSEGAMEQAARGGADQLISDMSPGEAGGIIGFLENLPFVGGVFSVLTDPIKVLFGKAGAFIEGIALGYGLGSLTGEAIAPLGASLVYSAHRAAGDGRISPELAGDMWAKGIMTEQQALHEALDQGFANDPDPNSPFPNIGRIQQFYDHALQWADPDTLLELLRRKVISDGDYTAAMTRHGYNTQQQGFIRQLSRQLLSPADLALGWLRGDVSDQLLANYSPLLGVDQADMAILIANTGEPPGAEMLMEAWRRGFIDQPRFDHGIRQSRIRNEWIGTLEALRYSPMSIADAARAVVQNYLPEPDGASIAQMNGLEPDHWQPILLSYGRPLSRTEMSALYYRGQVSRDQFDQAMRESDMKDKYIPQAFELGRRLIPERQVTTMLQHGVITKDSAIAYLMMQGYTQQDAQYLVALGAEEHHQALKELTKADIQTLYTDRLITREQAVAKLRFLGYDQPTSDWILSLADARHTASLARTLQTQVRALFAKRELTRDEAIQKLIDGGVERENAHALVDEWELTHRIPSRTLTEAQTIKAAENGVIDIQEARGRLAGLGYTDADATILLKLAGLVDYVPIPQSTGGGSGGAGGGAGG